MNIAKTGAALCLAAQLCPCPAAEPVNPAYLQTREPARHALVIGNEAYARHERLASASKDAFEMAENLRRMNYRVLHVPNLASVADLEDKVLPEFRPRIAAGDIVVFYFSGHGFGHGPFNYLAPVSMPSNVRSDELRRHAIAIENIESALRATSPGMMLFVIDACRTLSGLVIDPPPAPGPLNLTGGAPATAPPGFIPKGMSSQPTPDITTNIITVYAAAPGNVAWASSAPDKMSVFTSSFASRMRQKHKEVRSILDEVTADVQVMSAARQAPTVYRGTAADLFLEEIPPDTLAAQRQAWLATLDSNAREQVQWFSYRFAVSPYASPARQWLSDHAEGSEEAAFTLADPLAVERVWGQRAAIVVPSGGLAFPRSSVAVPATVLSDREAGVIRRGQAPAPATTETLVKDVQRMMSRRGAVTIRDYAGRAAPSHDAKTVMRVPFGTPITITGIERRSADSVWVAAVTPSGGAPVYLNLEPHALPTMPIDLGQSLEELKVPARERFPYLVEDTGIRDALAGLARSGKKVTWVSIAAPPVEDTVKRDEQRARISHVAYLLKQAGVDGKRITAVHQAADVAHADVRLRIFGH